MHTYWKLNKGAGEPSPVVHRFLPDCHWSIGHPFHKQGPFDALSLLASLSENANPILAPMLLNCERAGSQAHACLYICGEDDPHSCGGEPLVETPIDD
jgi:hypothetical protein